jgi:hypothetical protein
MTGGVRYLAHGDIAKWLEISPAAFSAIRRKGTIAPIIDAGSGKRSCWREADLRPLRPGVELPPAPTSDELFSAAERKRAARYRRDFKWLMPAPAAPVIAVRELPPAMPRVVALVSRRERSSGCSCPTPDVRWDGREAAPVILHEPTCPRAEQAERVG